MFLGGMLVLGGLVAFFLYNVASTPNGTPQLSVSESAIDLGDVQLGEWVSASFQVTNTDTAALQFHEMPYIEVAAGC